MLKNLKQYCIPRPTDPHPPVVSQEQDVEGSHGEAAAAHARRRGGGGARGRLARRAAREVSSRSRASARAKGCDTACTCCRGRDLKMLLMQCGHSERLLYQERELAHYTSSIHEIYHTLTEFSAFTRSQTINHFLTLLTFHLLPGLRSPHSGRVPRARQRGWSSRASRSPGPRGAAAR